MYISGSHQSPPEEMSGTYSDPVSISFLIFAGIWVVVWGGLAVGLAPGAPLAVVIFLLLFPLPGILAGLQALACATLAFDRSGWHYRRAIFGRTLETEEGSWTDIAQTAFRQWVVRTRNGPNLVMGEFALIGSNGQLTLKAHSQFYPPARMSVSHSVGKRLIGLSEFDFGSFVRLINQETPQLGYEWVRSMPDEDAPAPRGFFGMSAGPDRYVTAARGAAVTDGEPVDAEAGWGGQPVPF